MAGRFVLGALAGLAAMLALATSTAVAAPERDTHVHGNVALFDVDPFAEEAQIDVMSTSTSSGTQHIGPIASTSPDSGTCGNDWAEDTFDRYFTIKSNNDGTYTVYEQFKNGSFVTNAGFSPGACEESDGSSPGILTQGLAGTMHGYISTIIACDPLLPNCFNAGATCQAANACDTTNNFITTFFGPAASRNDEAYFFHYVGYDGSNQALVYHEWKNASCNRGGDHGDIATAAAALPPPTFTVCI